MDSAKILEREEWQAGWKGPRCVVCALPCSEGECGAGAGLGTRDEHAAADHACAQCGEYVCGTHTGDGGLCQICLTPHEDEAEPAECDCGVTRPDRATGPNGEHAADCESRQ